MAEPELTIDEATTAREASSIDVCAAKGAQASACWCGRPLPAWRGGRPAKHCSTACRRRHQAIERKLRLREEAIVAWHQVRRGGDYSEARRRREIAQLRREVFELLEQLVAPKGTI